MEVYKKNSVFYISSFIIAVIVLWGLIFPAGFEKMGTFLFSIIVDNFSWFYMLAMTSFIIFAIWVAFISPYKDIKLGDENSKPEYSTASWLAMLFSAGMGIGLVFYGVAEPLNHYANPIGLQPFSSEAAKFAITKSFLHWGLHPWANYSILGLGLAYMQFRRKKPALVSSIFIPLVGEEKVKGVFGKTIDVLAIFATSAGMATSLGLGTYQINSGLNYLFGIPENATIQISLVVIVTIIYTWTALSGVNKGIKWISNINMMLVAILLLTSIIVGPTIGIFNTITESIGHYFQNIVRNSFEVGAFGNTKWYGSWTVFYWAWFIAWAPFTGTFIARISKGRTIKEFIIGVLLVPASISFIWFGIFGAINFASTKEILLQASEITSTAFFVVMGELPLGTFISIITIVLLFTFFITSANSATFVLGMFSHQGELEPPNSKKLFWGITQAALALSLMIGSANGLGMLQTISIVAAFPFTFIMILTMVSLVKAMKKDKEV